MKKCKKCKNCKFWKKIPIGTGYGADAFDHIQMGYCKSDKIAKNPNYYENYEGVATKDMALTTYEFSTGSEFGCVHHESEGGNKLTIGLIDIDDIDLDSLTRIFQD